MNFDQAFDIMLVVVIDSVQNYYISFSNEQDAMTLPCLFDSQICISITNGGDGIFIFCLDAVLHKKHDLNIQLTFHYLTMELTSLNMKKVFHPKLPSKLVVELIHVGDLNNDRIILFWHFFSCIVQTAHIDKNYERSIMNAFKTSCV